MLLYLLLCIYRNGVVDRCVTIYETIIVYIDGNIIYK